MTEAMQDVYERVMDVAGVRALLDDVVALGQEVELRVKAAPGAMSEVLDQSLWSEALARLQGGELRALQLTYSHGGRRWRDTVLQVSPKAYRVLRVGARESGLPDHN